MESQNKFKNTIESSAPGVKIRLGCHRFQTCRMAWHTWSLSWYQQRQIRWRSTSGWNWKYGRFSVLIMEYKYALHAFAMFAKSSTREGGDETWKRNTLNRERFLKIWWIFRTGLGDRCVDIYYLSNLSLDAGRSFRCKRLACNESEKSAVSKFYRELAKLSDVSGLC